MSIKLIKDSVRGNNIFSNIEDLVFSSSLYNRLHNILQNSSTYLVYPSIRTSRFVHGLGVMNLSTKIFNSGISNSSQDVLSNYFDSKYKIIISIIENSNNELIHGFKRTNKVATNLLLKEEDYLVHLLNQLGANFVNHVAVNHSIFKKEKFFITYLILLQTLRLFALLHDFGHLPYSHIMEFAISGFYYTLTNSEKVNSKSKKNEKILTDAQKKFVKNYEKFFTIKDKQLHIHEVVGKNLIKILLASFGFRYTKNTKSDRYSLFTLQLLFDVLNEIFLGKDGQLNSIYEIVASELDADRIDYASRDGQALGVNSSFDIERVTSLFCLSERKNAEEEIDKFAFYPSIQSLNDIKELFNIRFRVYKNVINHHKVKRFDYILQKSIETILVKEYSNGETQDDVIFFKIRNMLETIFALIKDIDKIISNSDDTELTTYKFSQLTDAWLLTLLYSEIINLLKKDNDALTETDKYLKTLLNEFFTNSKEIKSLWKRDFEYLSFCEELGKRISPLMGELKENNIFKLFFEENGISLNENDSNNSHLNNIDFKTLGIILISFLNINRKDWVVDLTLKFKKGNKIILLCPSNLKTVKKDIIFVDIKDTKQKFYFNEISNLPKYLKEEEKNSIQFFVYYQSSEPTEIRKKIIEEIYNYIKMLVVSSNKKSNY